MEKKWSVSRSNIDELAPHGMTASYGKFFFINNRYEPDIKLMIGARDGKAARKICTMLNRLDAEILLPDNHEVRPVRRRK